MGDSQQDIAGGSDAPAFTNEVVFLHPIGVVVGQRRDVVIDDGNGRRAVDERGADGVAEHDAECLVTLDQAVGNDVLRDHEPDVARGDSDRSRLGTAEVIIRGCGRPRNNGVRDGDGLRRRLAQRDQERHLASVTIGAFDDARTGNAPRDRRASRHEHHAARAGFAADTHVHAYHDVDCGIGIGIGIGRQNDVDDVLEQQRLGAGRDAGLWIYGHEVVVERDKAVATLAGPATGRAGRGRGQRRGGVGPGLDGGLEVFHRLAVGNRFGRRTGLRNQVGIERGLGVAAEIKPATCVELDGDGRGGRSPDDLFGVDDVPYREHPLDAIGVNSDDVADDDADDAYLLRCHSGSREKAGRVDGASTTSGRGLSIIAVRMVPTSASKILALGTAHGLRGTICSPARRRSESPAVHQVVGALWMGALTVHAERAPARARSAAAGSAGRSCGRSGCQRWRSYRELSAATGRP